MSADYGGPDKHAVTTGGILALDLSGIVGWCYGRIDDVLPLFGTWHLSESKLLGPRYVAFENELIDALDRFQPKLVIAEAPLPSNRQGSTNVARQQFGLAAYVEGECWRRQIECREQPAHQVRKTVLGKGSFGSSEAAKAQVLAYARAQGWKVPDHNAADACVLWRYACFVRRPRAIA